MEQADLIWHNGELVAWEDAKVHVLTHGLHYGTGVFEGDPRLRDRARAPAIFRHHDHLDRLFQSAELYYMPIPYTLEELRSGDARADRRQRSARVLHPPDRVPRLRRRWACTRSTRRSRSRSRRGRGAPTWARRSSSVGIRAKVSSWRRISHDSLIPARQGHRPVPEQHPGQDRGDEGRLRGGDPARLARVRRARAAARTSTWSGTARSCTPPQTAGILDGISRKSVIQIARDLGYEVVERDIARAELYLADEVFLTGTAAELVPVREIDDHAIGSGEPRADHRRSSSACSTTRCTAATRATWSGSTSCEVPAARRRMSTIELYDTTLRDGMQGEGMSLSAQEKLRVAHRLDELGIDLIEAGFPSSNPKELELFELLGRRAFEHASDRRVRDDPPARRARAADDPALRVLADCFAPVCTLVGKTWGLHLEKVVKVDREENLRMISESIAFLVGRRQARHLRRRALLRRLRRRPRVRARLPARGRRGGRRDRRLLRHQRRHAARRGSPRRWRRWSGELAPDRRPGRDPLPRRRRLRRRELARRGRGRGARHVQGTMNGYGERCGNANLVTIIPNLQLKLGYECVSAEQLRALTATAHFFDELLNFTPDPDQPYVGRNAFAHKGGMHVAGVNADPATFEHIEPEVVGNRRELLVSELSGKGTVHARAREAGISARRRRRRAGVIERVKELEHAGYHFEAADGSFELLLRKETGDYEPLFRLESWRVIVEKRADGRVETEATIKIWVDGERYVRTAEGNGPVNALDRALRDALGRDLPAPARHRARQLQGPHPRRDQGHRRGHARAARRLRRRAGVGLDRRLGERDRGLVGGAGRLARVRHAGAARGRARGEAAARSARDRRRASVSRGARGDPARAAGARRSRGASACSRCCAPGRLSLGRDGARVRAGVRRARRRAHRERGLERDRRAAPGAARRRRQRRRRGRSRRRSRSSPAPTSRSTSARGRCSPTSTR